LWSCLHASIFSVPMFQGVGEKFNSNKNLNSPSEDGTLVPPEYVRGDCFAGFPSVALVCAARKLRASVLEATQT